MNQMRAIGLALLVVAVAASTAVHQKSHTFFTRTTVPKGWTLGAPAPANAAVNFIIALKQRNLEALEALFWAVSTPGTDQYQKFLTKDEILDLVAPETPCHDSVMEWLKSAGKVQVKSTRDAIEVHTSAHVAEKLFK